MHGCNSITNTTLTHSFRKGTCQNNCKCVYVPPTRPTTTPTTTVTTTVTTTTSTICQPIVEWADWGPCNKPCSNSSVQIRYKEVVRSCGDSDAADLQKAYESRDCSVKYTAAGVRAEGSSGFSFSGNSEAPAYSVLFDPNGLQYIAAELWDVMYPSTDFVTGVDTPFTRWGGKVKVNFYYLLCSSCLKSFFHLPSR